MLQPPLRSGADDMSAGSLGEMGLHPHLLPERSTYISSVTASTWTSSTVPSGTSSTTPSASAIMYRTPPYEIVHPWGTLVSLVRKMRLRSVPSGSGMKSLTGSRGGYEN